MPRKKISLIAFDLFGVIFSEGHLISNALMHLLPASIDKQQVKFLYERYNLGEINEAGFWSELDISEYKSIREKFINSFELNEYYSAVMKMLGENYQLAILSNLPSDWADELTRKFSFEERFSPIVFSGQVGCKKPSVEIYHELIKRSGVDAGNIIFIDDRLENLKTAHELGMATVYFEREAESYSFRPDFSIQQLNELPRIL